MRTNIQFDHAQFITKLEPYQEKDGSNVEYIVTDRLVNFASVHQPDLPRPIQSTFRLYQSRVEMKVCGYPPVKAMLVRRGVVAMAFSRKSRRRLMNAFHSWQCPSDFKRYHITLTYPGVYDQDWNVWKIHLKAIKRRLQAIFHEIEGYWRLELQPKRKAPHYHLMVAIPKGVVTNKKLKTIITKEWAKIAHKGDQYEGKYATKVQVIHNDAMATLYISKYCAKMPPQKEKAADTKENADFAEQFERETIAFRHEQLVEKTIGRQWGRVGRPNEAPLAEMQCSVQDQDILRSVCAMWLEKIGSDFSDRVKYCPEYQSYQVYGLKGYAMMLVAPELFPIRPKLPKFSPYVDKGRN
jgi:hypothetical protein